MADVGRQAEREGGREGGVFRRGEWVKWVGGRGWEGEGEQRETERERAKRGERERVS